MPRSRETRAYTWFHHLLRLVLGPPFRWYYRVEGASVRVVRALRPPFLVIPNHVTTWDPLVVSDYVREPIHFVASDANFRSSIFSWWLRRVGAIAMSKLAGDLATMRIVMRLLSEGKVVGLFAEGQRTWDGATLPIIPATAKLVKIARVPVVVPVIRGGYLSLPRWAYRGRRGRIIVEYRLALTADDVARMTVDQIRERIESTMRHEESDPGDVGLLRAVSARSAEPLELVLFTCPSCRSIATMHSRGKRFSCTACGYAVQYTSTGGFRRLPGGDSAAPVFGSVREWCRFQEPLLAGLVDAAASGDPTRELFGDDGVAFLTGYRLASLHRRGVGRLSLTPDGLRFAGSDGQDCFFPWDRVSAFNVVYQNQIEFYCQRRLHVFKPGRRQSGYKYLLAAQRLQSLRDEQPAGARAVARAELTDS